MGLGNEATIHNVLQVQTCVGSTNIPPPLLVHGQEYIYIDVGINQCTSIPTTLQLKWSWHTYIFLWG